MRGSSASLAGGSQGSTSTPSKRPIRSIYALPWQRGPAPPWRRGTAIYSPPTATTMTATYMAFTNGKNYVQQSRILIFADSLSSSTAGEHMRRQQITASNKRGLTPVIPTPAFRLPQSTDQYVAHPLARSHSSSIWLYVRDIPKDAMQSAQHSMVFPWTRITRSNLCGHLDTLDGASTNPGASAVTKTVIPHVNMGMANSVELHATST